MNTDAERDYENRLLVTLLQDITGETTMTRTGWFICPNCGFGTDDAKQMASHSCVQCKGGNHHWLPSTDQPPDKIMLDCKHCDARREAAPDDEY